ncbi:hypothetical protein [Limnofasciculus baicalensis]|uniref:Uncharacterized protein n=1 Tax=Limnofasciculus baicalensis BBK-W-15 TaxID=2699891 RepID=A0AAE3GNZ4_9CYAN|nr:hypothetical protein [Limnofasciculus baicalensis]MCP2727143.1 hypothetical protein [Limnofasciculus baicalensis BBK-W-15]
MGRLNRWVNRTAGGKYQLQTGRICQALIYPWDNKHPYKQEELETGTTFVNALTGKRVNQIQLAQQISKISIAAPLPETSEWLKTWQATSGELVPLGYTIQVILADDIAKIFQPLVKPSLEAQKWAVSVRITNKTKNWERNKALKFYRIAPTKEVYYHPEIGEYEPNNELLKNRYGHKT